METVATPTIFGNKKSRKGGDKVENNSAYVKNINESTFKRRRSS